MHRTNTNVPISWVFLYYRPEEENEGGEKEDRGAGYNPQMRQNNFVPYFNRQNMMNGGQNYRQGPQFIPPKFTMEQQMQMQIMQRQRMLAAAQAQAFMNQQQHFPQPPAQHYSQPPAQHYSQPPAQHYSQPPAQHYSQPSAQHYAQPPVHQYQPPAPVAPQPSPQ